MGTYAMGRIREDDEQKLSGAVLFNESSMSKCLLARAFSTFCIQVPPNMDEFLLLSSRNIVHVFHPYFNHQGKHCSKPSSAVPHGQFQSWFTHKKQLQPRQVLLSCCFTQGVYRSYLANSKFVSASSAPHIAFMQTCAIELWGLDLQVLYARAVFAIRQLAVYLLSILCLQMSYAHAFSAILQLAVSLLSILCLQMSYAHAFSAIRQLAVSLRGALNMKTKDGYKEVCGQRLLHLPPALYNHALLST
eukprot:1161224-Pelagomonas_calceolata.AAC.11